MRPDHSLRSLLLPALALACLAVATPAAAAEPPKTIEYVDGVPDTGQFLPNSEVLARVADRSISVFAFRDFYFLSKPEIRPGRDSLGRAEFLTNMIRKEVLGLSALAANIPLGFEARSILREHRSTLLSNRLFEKYVMSFDTPPEDSLRKVYDHHRTELRLRVLHFTDRTQAEAARASLVKGAATWKATSDRYNPPALRAGEGSLDWAKFESVPTEIALVLWNVKPGQYSPVLLAAGGYQLFQVTERRDRPFAEYSIMRPSIVALLRNHAASLRQREIMAVAKQGLDIRYDTTNVVYAAKRFGQAVTVGREGSAQTIHIDENVPEFADEDTARTILTWTGGRLTLGRLLHEYSHVASVLRPAINTPELFMGYADAIVTAPRMIEIAVERGLEKDPAFLAAYEGKREQLLVERMVEDSVFSRITVSKQERRDFYQKNRNGFVTYPSIRYAVVVRPSKAGADSVLARLRGGANIFDVLRADSLAGNFSSGIKNATTQDRGLYEKVIFEEMRPGQSRVLGPDAQKHWACVHLIEFDPGRQMAYEEVEGIVDESVRNLKAEEALNAFVGRLMKRYPVEARYDLLMRVKLTTPSEDERPR